MADLGDLAAKMKVLSDAYAAQLPEKFAQMEQVWQQLQGNEWNEEVFQMLCRMVHSFNGSGKTFGISALSDVARDLEEYLMQLAQAKVELSTDQRRHVEKAMTELRKASLQRDGK